MLLVLAQNPDLTIKEVDAILRATAVVPDPRDAEGDPALADPRDILPFGRDPDGHNAKHGYGRLSATNACIAASDPIALTLLRMGETRAARNFHQARRTSLGAGYSMTLGRWLALRALSDSTIAHAVASLMRALRLWIRHPHRVAEQPPGHLLRQIGLLVRMLAHEPAPEAHREELYRIDVSVRVAQGTGHAARVEQGVIEAVLSATGWARATDLRAVTQSGAMLTPSAEEAGGAPGSSTTAAKSAL
jgi:hypothetical protein